jgi:hypothetical protein
MHSMYLDKWRQMQSGDFHIYCGRHLTLITDKWVTGVYNLDLPSKTMREIQNSWKQHNENDLLLPTKDTAYCMRCLYTRTLRQMLRGSI